MLNKYQVIEVIPYEGENLWTVFAYTPEEAKAFVKQHYLYSDEGLDCNLLQHNIRGTKQCGVIKYTTKHYE